MVEAVLLDVHFMKHLASHPHAKIQASILHDQLLGNGATPLRRCSGDKALAKVSFVAGLG